MIKKILYISGTRADYGLMHSVLKKIDNNPNFELYIGATGMHLMQEFGKTIQEIYKDGFKIIEIDTVYEHDDRASMAVFIGNFIRDSTTLVKNLNPDMILVLGDRAEMLGGAIVGTYLNIPIIHIHGGEISSTVDEHIRHAITKLAHVHLAATQKSADRIIKMGENPKNVYLVGAPGLDEIVNGEFTSSKILAPKYQLNLTAPLLLVIQHPVSAELDMAQAQMLETISAIIEEKYQTVIIYPNADAGGRQMIKIIQSYETYPFIHAFKSIPHQDYLGLLKISSVLLGNSSSGIIEAASLHIPVINIGSRQHGREHTANVIDVNYNKDEIRKAIYRALYDKRFLAEVKICGNPYGNGRASDKIIQVLSKIKPQKGLLQKRIMY
jgi:GDP/UDP-N,N'-diacetylbacillosamine 2-epimerase (hydrolysing)